MEKISVIIPVYNTGDYLQKCIESITAQTYKLLEILLIDDGSAEYTAELCDNLAAKDNRIRVYHKENEGVSIARNYGIKKATGDYICFVDSDDWIDNCMYENLYQKIMETDADIVFCDARTVRGNGKIEMDTLDIAPPGLQNKAEISPDTLCQLAGSAWRGLYKSSTIKSVFFPEGLKFSEDRFFNLQAITKSNSIFYLKQAYYNRYIREGSCVNSYHSNGITVVKKAYRLIDSFVVNEWGYDYLKPYYIQKAYSYLSLLYGVFKSGKPLVDKYREIKEIASDCDLHSLLKSIATKDIRFKLIMECRYMSLFLLLLAHNFYKNVKK